MLGLTEDDTHKAGDRTDTRKVEEEVKACLKGKYDDAYDVFAYVDKVLSFSLSHSVSSSAAASRKQRSHLEWSVTALNRGRPR